MKMMFGKKYDRTIGNFQILRVFAASGVVIYHTNIVINGRHTEFSGVALFFALSGYLMCKISSRSALDFAKDRFWRIVPNYWLAMILLYTLFKMWAYWPIEHTLLSAFFIPHDSIVGFYPVLGVGWTLNLELYFYAIFAVSILINHRFAPIITGLIILAISFGLPYFTDNNAVIFYYTHGYIKYFVIGIAIWYFSEWVKHTSLRISLPRWTLPLSLVGYSVIVITIQDINPVFLVSALFLITVLASNFGADLKPQVIMLMGDASYACYLLHTILIELLRSKGIVISGTIPFSIGVLVGSWMIAIVWHIYVERIILILRGWADRIFLMTNQGN